MTLAHKKHLCKKKVIHKIQFTFTNHALQCHHFLPSQNLSSTNQKVKMKICCNFISDLSSSQPFLLNWYSYSVYLQTYCYAYIFISIVDLNYTLPNWQTRKLICMCITVLFISKGFYNAPTKNENKNEWQYIQINQSTFNGLIQCRHGRWKIWEFRLRLVQIRTSTIITRITATLNVERIGYLTTKPFNSAILFYNFLFAVDFALLIYCYAYILLELLK